ncbi:MAG: class I SAM-dependent methyltransferase [Bacteroidales bacterium]|nr:class I SAM-dependent methyltransferase [Bacteroidales bacterium]
MPYLTILGFLVKQNDRYELTHDTATFLDSSSPAYLGGVTAFLLQPELQDAFQNLTQAVQKGGTAMPGAGTVSPDNPIWVAFARAMAPMMDLPSRLLAPHAGEDTQRPLRVLDVAAGHGLFGIRVAETFPHARITALDWPNVVAVAAENAHHAGIADRHTTLPGDAFALDWGGPYDVVLFTNFLHHFDLPTCEQLARKAHAALVPGGRVLTLEFVPDADRIHPPATATFALTMLASTASGDAYTFAEYDQLFQKAGFTRNEFHPLPPTTQQAVVSHKA